ncbi:MAG: arginase family protein [Candidatus Aenigmatarchaeota archaeon]
MLYARNSFTTNYDLDEADVCFLGVSFDSTALAEGNQRFGPTLVREALKTKISYVPQKGNNPLKELKICDLGDLDWVPGSFEETSKRLKDTIKSIFEENEEVFPVFLGGEHLVSLPIVEELKPKTVVQLDAHLDRAEEYQGNEYAHNTWVSKVEDVDFVQVGCRSYTEDQDDGEDYMDLEKAKEKIRKAGEPVYLTVDMDVFDPRYAPDVGFPEENGLSPDQVFEILDEVFEKKVVGMDVCEVASKELNNRTAHLAAKTILRALSNLC